jgi:hypothetical protein
MMPEFNLQASEPIYSAHLCSPPESQWLPRTRLYRISRISRQPALHGLGLRRSRSLLVLLMKVHLIVI